MNRRRVRATTHGRSISSQQPQVQATTDKFAQCKCLLQVHDTTTSDNIIINAQFFPQFFVGDVVEIVSATKLLTGHLPPLMIRIDSLETQYTKPVQHLSIAKPLADLYGLSARQTVLVRSTPPENAYLDYVEISVRDHFIPRADMFRFSAYLNHQVIHEFKHLEWNKYHVTAKELLKRSSDSSILQKVPSGIVLHGHTKITFRSRSAVLYWLFQMSKEMWEYTIDGDLHFEKAVNGFMSEVLERFKALDVNHSLCLIFFSRHFIDNYHRLDLSNIELTKNIITLPDGRKCLDFYKVIDWNETQQIGLQDMLIRLKQEFLAYHSTIMGFANQKNLYLNNSGAVDGNFFEAVNLVLNSYDISHVNRDLSRTGESILVISPSTGVYNNLIPNLERITTKRLMDHGLGVDLICLADPPLHSVPLVINQRRNAHGLPYSYYTSPDWLNITFYQDRSRGFNSFYPTCKMPNSNNFVTRLRVPKIPDLKHSDLLEFESHDEDVFADDSQDICPSADSLSQSLASSFSCHNLEQYADERSSIRRCRSIDSKLCDEDRRDPLEREPFNLQLLNPFDIVSDVDALSPSSLQHGDTLHRRRWVHLHPSSAGIRPIQKAEYIKAFLLRINWQSLAEPASMPMTTDYWPSNLSGDAFESMEIYPISNDSVNTKSLLQELVCQRLQEGNFQIYSEDDKHYHQKTYQLCSSGQYHTLTIQNNKINVDSFLVKDSEDVVVEEDEEVTPVSSVVHAYSYLLFNMTSFRFENRNLRFYSQLAYNWQKLDALISGAADRTDDLHSNCLQYYLIPVTSTNKRYMNSFSLYSGQQSESFSSLDSLVKESPSPSSFDLNGDIFKPQLSPTHAVVGGMHELRMKEFERLKDTFVGPPFRLAKASNVDITVVDMDQTPTSGDNKQTRVIRMEKVASGAEDTTEWFYLHHNSTYNPAEAFPLRIEWLACSPSLITYYINNLQRRAPKFGFMLVQTPVDVDSYARNVDNSEHQGRTSDELHPFRTFFDITLPDGSIEFIKDKVCCYPLNFFPESVPVSHCNTFIHETGCIILEFRTNSVLWIDNPFHLYPVKQVKFNPMDLLHKLQKLIEDVCIKGDV